MTPKIMVVDDDSLTLKRLRRILENQGVCCFILFKSFGRAYADGNPSIGSGDYRCEELSYQCGDHTIAQFERAAGRYSFAGLSYYSAIEPKIFPIINFPEIHTFSL